MIPALIGAGAQAGMGLYGYYQDSKAKDQAARQLEATQRDVAARDSLYSNKMNSRYNDDLLRKETALSGDFSKVGPLYSNMKSQVGRAGDMAKDNAIDDATKRGLGSTGLGAQLVSGVDNGVTNAVAGAMGQYANSLEANPNLINSAYGMNQGMTNELQQNTMDYNMIQPSLGGVMSAVGSGLDVVDAHNTKVDNQKYIDDILAKYTEAMG